MSEKAKPELSPSRASGLMRGPEESRRTSSPQAFSSPLTALQQTIGNQAILRLLESGLIQAKLRVSQPGDADEVEADRVAEQVVNTARSPQIHRKCACEGTGSPCAECESEASQSATSIRRKPDSTSSGTKEVHDSFLGNLGPGRPLDAAVRSTLEPRFGRDFSEVRIHSGSNAEDLAQSFEARAFTIGNNLVFAKGEYQPTSASGLRLLSHELTHVVQNQRAGASSSPGTSGTTVVQRESLLGTASSFWSAKEAAAGKWIDEKKWQAYRAMIGALKSSKNASVAQLRALVSKLPNSLQGAAATIVDAYDFVEDMLISLLLAIIGLAVGFVSGIVSLVLGILKLALGLIKMVVDALVALMGKPKEFNQDLENLAAAVLGIPPGLKKIVDDWLERYKHASAEEQVLMGGELVGQIEAFIATFALAGTKAGQAGSISVRVSSGGTRVLEAVGVGGLREAPAVATVVVPAVVPKTAAEAAIVSSQMMMMSTPGSAGGGGGGAGGERGGPTKAPASETEPNPETRQKAPPAEVPPEKTPGGSPAKAPPEPVEGKTLTPESPKFRKPGEGIPVDAAWGNPKSVKAYGHSLLEHGPKRPFQQLIDRAAGTKTPQGQWLDENFIVDAEQRAPLKPGEHIVDMGKPVGKVYMPDGSVVENVSKVKVIRRADLTVNTSYPVSGETP